MAKQEKTAAAEPVSPIVSQAVIVLTELPDGQIYIQTHVSGGEGEAASDLADRLSKAAELMWRKIDLSRRSKG